MMDRTLSYLLDLLLSQRNQVLAGTERCAAQRAEVQALWDQFRRRYPDAVCGAALDLRDADGYLAALEREDALLFGLQLGLALGRLDLGLEP